LKTNDDIAARVLELQQVAACSCEISLESVCRELDQAIEVARAKGQAAPLVNAASLRARLGGLLVERVEIGAPDAFEEADTMPGVMGVLLRQWCRDDPDAQFTDDDRAKAEAIFTKWMAEIDELVKSALARPVNSPQSRPSQPNPAEIERKKSIAKRKRFFNGRNSPR
jgi:hypothetical protein